MLYGETYFANSTDCNRNCLNLISMQSKPYISFDVLLSQSRPWFRRWWIAMKKSRLWKIKFGSKFCSHCFDVLLTYFFWGISDLQSSNVLLRLHSVVTIANHEKLGTHITGVYTNIFSWKHYFRTCAQLTDLLCVGDEVISTGSST